MTLNILSLDNPSFYIISVLLGIIIYFTAFNEYGGTTCNKYLLNIFLYLLIMFSLYFSSIKIQNDFNINIGNDIKTIIISNIILFCMIVYLYFSKDPIVNHVLFIVVLFILALSAKEIYKKYDRDHIEDIIKKCMVVTFITMLLSLLFRKYINPKIETVLFFAAFSTFILFGIDEYYLESKYKNIINYFIVFVFAGFFFFDTSRLIQDKSECIEGQANYIKNLLNMFLNIITIFNSMVEIEKD